MTPAPLSLGDALAWLDRHVDFERDRRDASFDRSLVGIKALLETMGSPETDYPVIHVTGTNGKGSTVAIAAALLRAQGVSVGQMTSPHLERLNERIATDAGPIDDEALAELLGTLEQFERFLLERDRSAPVPTRFELVTAAGFRYFSDAAVEAAVVEVGLGGRFDSTNAVDAAVAVITNVELDHTEVLGTDRASIAQEKAGIIKASSAVIVGESDDGLVAVFEREAELVGARELWRYGEEFEATAAELAHGGRVLDLRTPGASYEGLYLPLFGAHQARNAAVALAAVEAFLQGPLAEDVVAEGLAAVVVPGRLEVVARRPTVVLDGAHNPAGAAALGRALEEDFSGVERIVLVFGCLVEHDPLDLVDAIGTDRVAHIVVTAPDSPRARPAEETADALGGLDVRIDVVEGVAEALLAAVSSADPDDLVVVTGSLTVVGAARSALGRLASPRP